MGFKEGNFPPVDPATFMDKPFLERLRDMSTHWVDYGFGTPKMVHTVYIMKLLFLYLAAGTAVAGPAGEGRQGPASPACGPSEHGCNSPPPAFGSLPSSNKAKPHSQHQPSAHLL